MKSFGRLLVVMGLLAWSPGCASIFGQQCTGDPTTWSCTCNGSKDPSCPSPWEPIPVEAKRPDAGTDGAR